MDMEVKRKKPKYRSVWAKGSLYCDKGDPLHPENCTQSTSECFCSNHAHLSDDGEPLHLLFTCLLCNETHIRYKKMPQHKKRKHPDLPKRGDVCSESKEEDGESAPEDHQEVSEMDDEADSGENQVEEDVKGEQWEAENQVGLRVRTLRIGVVEPVWRENTEFHIDVKLLRQLFPLVDYSVLSLFRQEQGCLNFLDAALCVMDSFQLAPTKIVKVWSCMKDFLEKIDNPQEMDSLDAVFCCNWFDYCFWLSRIQPGSSGCPSIHHTILRQVGSKLRKLQCERKIVIFPSIDYVSYLSSKSSYYADLCAKMPNACGLVPTRLLDPCEVAFDSKLQSLIAEEHMSLIVDEANTEHLISNMEDLRKLRNYLPSRAVLVAHQFDRRISRRAYRFLFMREKILLRFTWSCVPFPFTWQRSTPEDLELLPSNFGEIVLDVEMSLKQIVGASALVFAIDMILNVESADLEVFRIVPLKAEEFVSVGSYDVDEIRSLLGLFSATFHYAFQLREWKALSK